MKYLCIHCHFYQPPRENPWLEEIEVQDSAYPFHDWNEKISSECYRPNLHARILDSQQRVARIVNNYSKISFNFGPTLLSWAQGHDREMYEGLIEADRRSQKQFSGHGSAIAQAYNHIIMPLANTRDKATQIRWGFDDFVSRFHREPEGMWLPETAVDDETLDLMARAGLKFAILAPHQAKAVRPLKAESWIDVTGSRVDPTRAYLYRTGSGETISLFFYDGPISQAVAFEKLLDNGEKFAGRLLNGLSDSRSDSQMVHIATDGETYGHHHRHGEMALAYALDCVETKKTVRITNYGEFLEQNRPVWEVLIYERTAWSCVHGVERWRSNCGCNSGRAGWHQAWRAPLRDALDWLRDTLTPGFETLGRELLHDPWQARDAYIQVVLDRSPESRERFGKKHFRGKLDAQAEVQVWKLMELQRHAMLMYTSCGWFFDDLSGIETVQVIQYAGRVVQLAEQLFGDSFEEPFIQRLELAKSNVPEYGTGADVYRRSVKPSVVDLEKVGAHYSISSLFAPYGERADIFSYSVRRLDHHSSDAGKMRMSLGQAQLTSKITQESAALTFWVVHFGDHNVAGGVKKFDDPAEYRELLSTINERFAPLDIPEIVRLLDNRFSGKTYSLRSLFKDEQRRILRTILSTTVAEAEATYLQLYEHHAALMRFVNSLRTPIPREMMAAMENAINALLRRACAAEELDSEKIRSLLREAQASNISIDRTALELSLSRRFERLAKMFVADPLNVGRLEDLERSLKVVRQIPFAVSLWTAQNEVYALQTSLYGRMRRKAARGEPAASAWLEKYRELSKLLAISTENLPV